MKLWQPNQADIGALSIVQFRQWVNSEYQLELADFHAFHRWSVTHRGEFWDAVRRFCGVKLNHNDGAPILVDSDRIQGASWYPESTLNFAENLLFGGKHSRQDSDEAIVFHGENGTTTRLTQGELVTQVTRLAAGKFT